MKTPSTLTALIVLGSLLSISACSRPQSSGPVGPSQAESSLRVPKTPSTVPLKILGFNDFHGRLVEGERIDNRPVGGAAVLAAYLRNAMSGIENHTLIVHAGDLVGASPPESSMLRDEPTIQFVNTLTNASCQPDSPTPAKCNVVGTLGNHEFDRGQLELMRLLKGGNYAKGPYLQSPYPGASFPYTNANVFVSANGKPFIAPSLIREIGGIRVGVIGAIVKNTPSMVTPTGVQGLEFRDEADSINTQVEALAQSGVRTIVVALHQGSAQSPEYAGPTRSNVGSDLEISSLVSRLDDEVDVVISGHSHTFTNARIRTKSDHEILVVQAQSYGRAFDDIDLVIDSITGDVVAKSAQIVTTFADTFPGQVRDPLVQSIVDAAAKYVEPQISEIVTELASDVTRIPNDAGESALGDLITDAMRDSMGTDFAFTNDGGLRADLTFSANPANRHDRDGTLLKGELLAVLAFSNTLVSMKLSGQRIIDVLNQQEPSNRGLQVSGMTYTWDSSRPAGDQVVDVKKNGRSLDRNRTYVVTVNSYLANGGGGFSGFTLGTDLKEGPEDIDAVVSYLRKRTPTIAPVLERITKR